MSTLLCIIFLLSTLSQFSIVSAGDCPPGTYIYNDNGGCFGIIGFCGRRLLQSSCLSCDPGRFCPGDDTQQYCPIGYYCPNYGMTTGTQFPCTPSTRCPSYGMTQPDPFTCQPGQYVNATESCAGCPMGHSCNGINKIQCSPGTFNPLTSQASCSPCAAGYTCPNYTMTTVGPACQLGQLCVAGTATPKLCPTGLMCQTPSTSIDCPATFYCPEGTINATLSCPEKKYCPIRSGSPLNCPQGSFCPPSSASPTICPARNFCPANSSLPTLCTAGFYCDVPALPAPKQCLLGTYCGAGSQNQSDCGVGYFCETPASRILCPGGYFCVNALSKTPCSPGFFCSEGSSSPSPCLAGTYCNSNMMSQPMICEKGFYCPVNYLVSPLPCPAGRFCSATGLNQSTECPSGSFCKGGSIDPSPCSVPSKCPAGSSSQGVCDAGFFCTNTTRIVCPKGFYCPLDSDEPIPIPPGFYAPINGSVKPTLSCKAGFACPSGAAEPILCEAGSYSNEMSPLCLECASGRFTSLSGSNSSCLLCPPGSASLNESGSSGCRECLPGFFCPPGSNLMSAIACSGSSQYCPGNTSTALIVPKGAYATGCSQLPSGEVVHEQCKNISFCEVGRFCSGGISQSCSPGRFANITALSACFACDAGRFSDRDGEIVCFTCSSGKTTAQSGSTACQACAAGSFLNASSSPPQCSPCALGKFRSGEALQCLNCSAGEYTPSLGSVSCVPCPSGRFAPSSGHSATICVSCALGSYSSHESGSISCIECDQGFYCPKGSNTNSRILCASSSLICRGNTSTAEKMPSGHYVSRCLNNVTYEGCWSYEPCDKGYFCQNGQPEKCPVGRFANQTGLSICSRCSINSYSDEQGRTSCTSCRVGFFTTGDGSERCSGTAPGRFFNQSSAKPEDCPLGRYSVTEGALACDPCEPGRFISSGGSSFCLQCSQGSFAAIPGSSTCISCAAGKYSNTTGATSCAHCTGTTYSTLGSPQCFQCVEPLFPSADHSNCTRVTCELGYGFSSSQEFNIASSQSSGCRPCPVHTYGEGSVCRPCAVNTYAPAPGSIRCLDCNVEGLQCPGNSHPVVQENYWTYLSVNLDADANVAGSKTGRGRVELRSMTCPPNLCKGGRAPSLKDTVDPNAIIQQFARDQIHSSFIQYSLMNTESASPDASTVDLRQCPAGRDPSPSNTLCGSCLPGLVEWDNKCIECNETNGGLLFALILFSFVYVAVLHALSQKSRSDSKILIAFVQTALFQVGSNDENVNWMGLINFNVFQSSGSSCVSPMAPETRLAMSALIPLFFIAELGVMMAVHWILELPKVRPWTNKLYRFITCHSHSSSSSSTTLSISAHQIDFPTHSYCRTLFTLLNFSYLQIATFCLTFLNCVSVNGSSVVFTVPAIQCDTTQYQRWLGMIYTILVLIVCGYPVGLLGFLYRYKGKIQGRDPDFTAYYGILFESFKAKIGWVWTPSVLFRQVLLIGLSIAFQTHYTTRYLAYLYFNFGLLILTWIYEPNQDKVDNQFEMVAHSLLIIVTSLLLASKPPISSDILILIALAIIPFTIILSFLLLLNRVPKWKAQVNHVATKLGFMNSNHHSQSKGLHHAMGSVPANGSVGSVSLAPLPQQRGSTGGMDLIKASSVEGVPATKDDDENSQEARPRDELENDCNPDQSLTREHIREHQRSYSGNPLLAALNSAQHGQGDRFQSVSIQFDPVINHNPQTDGSEGHLSRGRTKSCESFHIPLSAGRINRSATMTFQPHSAGHTRGRSELERVAELLDTGDQCESTTVASQVDSDQMRSSAPSEANAAQPSVNTENWRPKTLQSPGNRGHFMDLSAIEESDQLPF